MSGVKIRQYSDHHRKRERGMMVEEYRRIFPVSFRTKDEAYEHLKYIFCEVLELHGYKNAKLTVSKEPWEDGFTVKFTWEIQTNADRIRAMTDEELAMWINDLTTNALSVLALGSNKQTKTISHWYDWLRKNATSD